jgi:hypothetical protein
MIERCPKANPWEGFVAAAQYWRDEALLALEI